MSTTKTAPQTQTIADAPAGWSQSVTSTQFDPALGTLQGIDVGRTADLNGGVAVRKWDAEGCAPLVVTGPQLNAAHRWINSIAGKAAA